MKKEQKQIFINPNSILFLNKIKSIQFDVDVKYASEKKRKECFEAALMSVWFDDGEWQEYLVLKSDIENIKHRIDMGYPSVAFTDKHKPMMDDRHQLIVESKPDKTKKEKSEDSHAKS